MATGVVHDDERCDNSFGYDHSNHRGCGQHYSVNIYTCGTLRKNRGEPVEIRNAGTAQCMKKGDTISKDNCRVTEPGNTKGQ